MNRSKISQSFNTEVLYCDIEAVLPCNLSNKWLKHLLNQAKTIRTAHHNSQTDELLSAISQILFHKDLYSEALHLLNFQYSERRPKIEDTMFFEYITQFEKELILEDARRGSEIDIAPASIETIFSDRNIQTIN
jgi:regulator of replication initiation timing